MKSSVLYGSGLMIPGNFQIQTFRNSSSHDTE